MVLSTCVSSQQSWAVKKPKLTTHAISNADDVSSFHQDEAARRLCQHWGGMFSARGTSIPNGWAQTMLALVQLAPPDLIWNIGSDRFEEHLASKRESAPGPDGLPYSVYRSAGGIGSKFLIAA